jgi:hypothetical protein
METYWGLEDKAPLLHLDPREREREREREDGLRAPLLLERGVHDLHRVYAYGGGEIISTHLLRIEYLACSHFTKLPRFSFNPHKSFRVFSHLHQEAQQSRNE